MNGIIYPEIANVSGAKSGGYLSDNAASQLSTFKTKATRARYIVQGTTIAITGTSANASITVPTGYAAVATVGVKYANNGGNLHIILEGDRYASSKAYVYYGKFATGTIKGNATVYVLFRRTNSA